jgi:hypothetical protein
LLGVYKIYNNSESSRNLGSVKARCVVTLFIFCLQVYNDQQWIQQYLITVRSTSDSEVSNLHKFLTETFLAPMQSLARQIQLQEAENQALNQLIVNQVWQ